ncbi:hypothetical protein T265_01708 [Opisthorchis viverrini]|uniref:XK-related protein n=1 Tax=Opisthorchis viverrini TaxID=6198 RepID=A0A075A987_OPIVI|nr:hypothetical protein T265_01708 [Opisthorchis viverrini]KER32290.1 hypothetical protein T265_01708 [Opisthorchis viverrini]
MYVRQSTPVESVANTNLESVASIIDDLISDRAIWRKVTCIILCLVFVLSAWIMVVLHVVHFTNQTILEVSVTVVTLLIGQYLGTGIFDCYRYWMRWNTASKKPHSKQQEENKEAWVCMRITLALMGLAPVSRYIESLVVVRRMIDLEKRYLAEAVAFAKEVKQPSTLPSGSLISGPSLATRQSEAAASSKNAARFRELDAGLVRVYKVRRQFRRTEQDAALVALASGVLGAGPFVFSQGVLFFRRVGLNFPMTDDAMVGVLSCTITGVVWLCAGLTHYYPAAYDQSEFDFDRGVGQVPAGGLALLYSAHLVHVTLRLGTLVLFTAQFYWIVMAVVAFHYFFVLFSLIVSRACTSADYSNQVKLERSSISGNLLSDFMFAYVGLFEFANAYAKYTRTRYLLYYFFYYLENSAMIGAWYVHFTYPQVWYYLPSLLITVVVQFLGFILLQIYLYLFSKPRRKTTLCGLCFRHLDPEGHQLVNPVSKHQGDGSVRRFDSVQTPSTFGLPETSVLSGRSGMPRRSTGGLYDAVFGQKISQAAIPKSHRRRGTASNLTAQAHPPEESTVTTKRTQAHPGTFNEKPHRVYKQYTRHSDAPVGHLQADSRRHPDDDRDVTGAAELLRRSSSRLLPISAEEAIERELDRFSRPHEPDRRRGRDEYSSREHTIVPPESGRSRYYHANASQPRNMTSSTNLEHAAPSQQPNRKTPQSGVFQPRPMAQRSRWPYSPNPRR